MKLSPDVSFGLYADVYDLLYEGKNYDAECDFVEAMARAHGRRQGHSLLDLGCGTAGHLVPLAQRGWAVAGVDISQRMLDRARHKTEATGLHIDLHQADIRYLRLNRRFDVVTCMFAVLGYVTETADLVSVLAGVREHLERGGVFVMDAWYGPAVLVQRPTKRVLKLTRDDLAITRRARPRLDTLRHVVEVSYELEVRRSGHPVERFAETHLMRFFFPQEIAHLVDAAGLELCVLSPFMRPTEELTTQHWNFSLIARAN